MFDLKSPCKTCPFRKSNGKAFNLHADRITEIVNADAFQCHKTVEYGEDDEGNEIRGGGDNPQQCAGLMSILHREGRPNMIMQVAERLRHFNPDMLDPNGLAYDSIADALNDHCIDELKPTKRKRER